MVNNATPASGTANACDATQDAPKNPAKNTQARTWPWRYAAYARRRPWRGVCISIPAVSSSQPVAKV